MASRLCVKCGKSMDENSQFYTYKNGEKTDMCKKCLTMHVDNWNPDTYLWILKECDVPYVPEEWNKLLLKYGHQCRSHRRYLEQA